MMFIQFRILVLVSLLIACLFVVPTVFAGDLVMARSQQAFPEAMLTLQDEIRNHGYKVSRVQRVDIGLTQMGFKTDKYRVVFFGKPDEIKKLAAWHPELTPYLPLKIAIFAEQNQTLVVATSPRTLGEFFPDLNLDPILDKWTQDLDSIFDAVRIKE